MPSSPELERGRRAFRERDWSAAYEALAGADRTAPLPVEDLERLAVAAYLTGRDDEHAAVLERAHLAHRDRGDDTAAARCAFWIALMQLFRGETARAGGWLARAQRLLGERECAEQGYVLLPMVERQLRQGEAESAIATASRAATVGERFGDRDLVASARHLQGRGLLQLGQLDKGLALLDEVMVAVTTGELSPVMTGLVYCSVIEACQRAWAVDRAAEWTSALNEWCDAQRGLVAFTAACLVRRAEIMQMRGAWPERVAHLPDRRPPPAALYQRAEVHRLRGEYREAEAAYRDAGAGGRDPQPGLALLRLAQGRTELAAQSIARALATAVDPLECSRLLPAQVEIALAADDRDRARKSVKELEDIAAGFAAPALRAMASQARGQVQLADGDAASAVGSLRQAWQLWKELDAFWLAARTRALIGQACRVLGDDDGAAVEFRAAREAFEQLGAAPELERLDASGRRTAGHAYPLSARELEVIRLVAAGKTNRTIAGQLAISEKTVARHLSNIFTKLGLSTRAAAAAWAWQYDLT
jgi:DNA-binding CsgD family transcriptional regulator